MNLDDELNDRLEAWYNGDLEDDDLSDSEVKELERLVFAAVMETITARDGVHTFPAHRTVQ